MKKYQLVIWMLLIVLGMGFIKFKYGYKGDGSEFLPTPTVIPTAVPTKVEDDYVLWKLLPYSDKGFTIDRYIGPKELAIKAKGLDKKVVFQKVNEWLLEQKVATESYKLVIE